MSSTDTAEAPETPDTTDGKKGSDRRAFIAAGAVIAACAGLVLFGVLNTDDKPKPKAVPTAEVTYEVTGTGTVEITYLAHSESGDATVEKAAELPWKKTVQVPLGKAPSINLTLDGKGGQVACSLAIQGRHVQTATAFGTYGRATCTG
ncbi:MmpS family transport accessory protein [Streptomyces sp. H39-C1]|uniref:MmpS family transport accessory protein n=1 Tax=Streptomyces sp. H39-C1 TaxID=3004355 RepID=UPI0022B057BA|nr:MmpS family transport accessory protein [Streptomyces sp. H39-C1]MCZ4103331.1 MmpS family transport accessory protein [Streptomyces sp. H39-C1]